MFEAIRNVARRLGVDLSEIYFDDANNGDPWGTEAEWKAWLDAGRFPGDGFLPAVPPPPLKPIRLPSERQHTRQPSAITVVTPFERQEEGGPSARPDFMKRGLLGTLVGSGRSDRPSGGPAIGLRRDREWLAGRKIRS
jgi:hypothetical protein